MADGSELAPNKCEKDILGAKLAPYLEQFAI